MSSPAAQPTSPLVEAKPLTFVDHIGNILRLVVKELRSIRADPTMLVLVVYAFSISVNTVATGAVTEATNLSVGIVDEDGSELSRQIAEGLGAADVSARRADQGVRYRFEDGSGRTSLRRRDTAELRGRPSRRAQDRRSDQRRCDRGGAGGQRRELSQDRHSQRNSEVSSRAAALERRADQPCRARGIQPESARQPGFRR